MFVLYIYIFFLRARHDHNKIAPCGMIKVFLIELNWIDTRRTWTEHTDTRRKMDSTHWQERDGQHTLTGERWTAHTDTTRKVDSRHWHQEKSGQHTLTGEKWTAHTDRRKVDSTPWHQEKGRRYTLTGERWTAHTDRGEMWTAHTDRRNVGSTHWQEKGGQHTLTPGERWTAYIDRRKVGSIHWQHTAEHADASELLQNWQCGMDETFEEREKRMYKHSRMKSSKDVTVAAWCKGWLQKQRPHAVWQNFNFSLVPQGKQITVYFASGTLEYLKSLPWHAGVKGNDRADRLEGKATLTSVLLLGRS